MTATSTPRVQPDAESPSTRALGLLTGLAVVAALALLDSQWGPQRIVIGLVIVGPFLTAQFARALDTAVVGGVAIAAAVLSGAWNGNWGGDAYLFRLAIVVVGAGLAIVSAESRTRLRESRRRFALLAALAELGDSTQTLQETVGRLCDLLVPSFADLVVVDALEHGEVRRLEVRASGPRAGEFEAWLRARPPEEPASGLASRHAARTGRAHLVERLDEDTRQAYALDEKDAEMLRAIGGRSTLTVPLRVRGQAIGALSLSVTDVSGRRYQPDDASFSEVLAGRAALALDNAGLFAELASSEARLSAVLGSLTDAVTVQTAEGRLLYANDAAAQAFGFGSVEEMLAAPPGAIIDRWDTFLEDGTPLRVRDLPGRKVLAGEAPEPLVVRAVNRDTGQERWSLIKATGVRATGDRPRLAVNVVEDITEQKRAERTQRLLSSASELLASSLDYESTLQQVAELAVPGLADWCGVSLPDGRGLLRQVAIAHVDPAKVRFGRELAARYPTRLDAPTGPAQVLRDGESQLANDIPPDLLRAGASDDQHYELIQQLGLRAAMVVPLKVGGRVIGTLTLGSAESGRVFAEGDLQVAEELARRAGTAVENARLYTERSNIAATLQAGLLPQPLPPMSGWSTGVLYRPAGSENWVGGDFYDAFPVKDGWMVVVGDVAGRGAPAAALTALTRYTIRAVAQLLEDPLDAVARLNRELYDRADGALCTVACAVLHDGEDGTGVAKILCAGHPQPYVIHAGHAERVGRFGPMVGALPEATWTPVTVALAPGDSLLLYTDGVIDTVGEAERFGEARLQASLAGSDGALDAVRRLDEALLDFESGEQVDDTAAVALTRVGARDAHAGDHPPPAEHAPKSTGARPAWPNGAPDIVLELPGSVYAPAAARLAIDERLGGALDGDGRNDVLILVSELVTNAVRYGGGGHGRPIVVRTALTEDAVLVEVCDDGPGFEPPATPVPRPEGGGMGLVLLATMTRAWGVDAQHGTKVWFELAR